MSTRFNGVYLMSVSGKGTIAAGPNGFIFTAEYSQDPTQQWRIEPFNPGSNSNIYRIQSVGTGLYPRSGNPSFSNTPFPWVITGSDTNGFKVASSGGISIVNGRSSCGPPGCIITITRFAASSPNIDKFRRK